MDQYQRPVQTRGDSANPLSIVAFVCALISASGICCCGPITWVLTLVSTICAIVALVQAKNAQHRDTTKVLNYIALVINFVVLVLSVLIFAFHIGTSLLGAVIPKEYQDSIPAYEQFEDPDYIEHESDKALQDAVEEVEPDEIHFTP